MASIWSITPREKKLLRALEIALIIAAIICCARALEVSGTRMESQIPAGESVHQLIKINGSAQQQYIMVTTTNESIQIKPSLLRLAPFTDGTVDVKATAPASGYVVIRAEKPGDKIAYGEEIRLTVCVGAPCPTPPTSNLSKAEIPYNTNVVHERTTIIPTYQPPPIETVNTNAYEHTPIWVYGLAALIGAWLIAMIAAFLMMRRRK